MDIDRWEFYLNARGLWCWRRVNPANTIVSDSKRCFPTRNDCIADAVEHGYRTTTAPRRHAKEAKWADTGPPSEYRRRAGAPGTG